MDKEEKRENKIRGRIKLFIEDIKEILVIVSFLVITVGVVISLLLMLRTT